jgi:hypothetical protein
LANDDASSQQKPQPAIADDQHGGLIDISA